jgi:hypothetical protein
MKRLTAVVFREVAQAEGATTRPALARAYVAVAAVEKRTSNDGARHTTESIVMDRARDRTGCERRTERGNPASSQAGA